MTPDERNRLVIAHLWLPRVLAARQPLKRGLGLDRADLEQAGNVGLLRAAGRWRPERGAFTTYAWPYVRGYILDAIRDAGGLPRRNEVIVCSISSGGEDGEPPEHRITRGLQTPAYTGDREDLRQAVRCLSGQEAAVVESRYYRDRPLRSCLPGRTRERARQVCETALGKLRAALTARNARHVEKSDRK